MDRLPREPLWIEATDAAGALAHLGTRPLKLVAEAVQPAFGESPWSAGAWQFKNLLAQPADGFQFSIAGPASRQDYHRHEGVFEIYAAEHRIEIEYFDAAGARFHAAIAAGALLVPPGVPHKVTLHGLTFVFQAAPAGRPVHADKTVLG